MPDLPTHPPAFRQLFDAKLIAALLALLTLGIVSCDLVTRTVNRKLLPLEQAPDVASFTTGAVVKVRLALKTQDAERHACASGQNFDELRCEHDATKRKVSRGAEQPADDNLRTILQPFKTATGEHSLLVGGLWHTPQLAFRRHREPSRERRGPQLQTFYADCELEVLGRLDSVDVRYDFGKSWSAVKNVPVTRAKQCNIVQAPELAAAPATR